MILSVFWLYELNDPIVLWSYCSRFSSDDPMILFVPVLILSSCWPFSFYDHVTLFLKLWSCDPVPFLDPIIRVVLFWYYDPITLWSYDPFDASIIGFSDPVGPRCDRMIRSALYDPVILVNGFSMLWSCDPVGLFQIIWLYRSFLWFNGPMIL